MNPGESNEISPRAKSTNDWRNEAIVAFVRLPVVGLFLAALYGFYKLEELSTRLQAEHVEALMSALAACAGQ